MAKSPLLDPKAWKGVWSALITPLRLTSNGLALDVESLESLIDSQIKAGIHGFVIAGSTGEGSLLSEALYKELLEKARAIVSDRAFVVAGLGIGGTDSCLSRLALAKECGYQGVLASPPAYIKAPQRGLVQHYLKIAAQALPVCVYEVASRASSSIDVATLGEMFQARGSENLVAVKDASGDLSRAENEVERLGTRCALLSGDDGSFAEFLRRGGQGIISVASQVVPEAMISILKKGLAGDFKGAQAEQKRIGELVDGLFWESNPIPLKSLLVRTRQIRDAVFCEPLVPMKKDLEDRLFALYSECKSFELKARA